jgi:hypothetical protein
MKSQCPFAFLLYCRCQQTFENLFRLSFFPFFFPYRVEPAALKLLVYVSPRREVVDERVAWEAHLL